MDHGVAGQPVASTQTLNRKKLIQCSQTASNRLRDQTAQTSQYLKLLQPVERRISAQKRADLDPALESIVQS